MQEVIKINSKKEVFDIKMTLKLIKMNENAIDKSLLKIKKAANFVCFFYCLNNPFIISEIEVL